MTLPIEDFGGRLASVWSELRPATRGLVEHALQNPPPAPARSVPYDARADHELRGNQLRHIAETCAAVLEEKTRSAEVFIQLVIRADKQRDYKRIDALADALTRFAPSEICELARSPEVVVRALSSEALAQLPTSVLIGLLSDPVDAEIARDALRRQADDYGSEEARQIVGALDQMNLNQEDL